MELLKIKNLLSNLLKTVSQRSLSLDSSQSINAGNLFGIFVWNSLYRIFSNSCKIQVPLKRFQYFDCNTNDDLTFSFFLFNHKRVHILVFSKVYRKNITYFDSALVCYIWCICYIYSNHRYFQETLILWGKILQVCILGGSIKNNTFHLVNQQLNVSGSFHILVRRERALGFSLHQWPPTLVPDTSLHFVHQEAYYSFSNYVRERGLGSARRVGSSITAANCRSVIMLIHSYSAGTGVNSYKPDLKLNSLCRNRFAPFS